MCFQPDSPRYGNSLHDHYEINWTDIIKISIKHNLRDSVKACRSRSYQVSTKFSLSTGYKLTNKCWFYYENRKKNIVLSVQTKKNFVVKLASEDNEVFAGRNYSRVKIFYANWKINFSKTFTSENKKNKVHLLSALNHELGDSVSTKKLIDFHFILFWKWKNYLPDILQDCKTFPEFTSNTVTQFVSSKTSRTFKIGWSAIFLQFTEISRNPSTFSMFESPAISGIWFRFPD